MSILDRLNLLVRSNLNELSARGTNRDAVRDMESSLRDARRQLVELRASEKRLIARLRELRDKADQWEDRAVLALRRGEEDLARDALVVKNQTLGELEHLRDQLDQHRGYTRDVESSLRALENKLDSTRTRLEDRQRNVRRDARPRRDESDWDREMQRRMRDGDDERDAPPRRSSYEEERRSYRPSSTREEPPRGTDGSLFSTGDAFDQFDRMEQKINRFEADVAADEELGLEDIIDPRKRELEDTFRKMEQRKRVSDDLSDLKKRFSDD